MLSFGQGSVGGYELHCFPQGHSWAGNDSSEDRAFLRHIGEKSASSSPAQAPVHTVLWKLQEQQTL